MLNIEPWWTSDRTKPNRTMTEKVLPFLQEQHVKRVLDYGCGKFLRDSLLLTDKGMKVDAVDLEAQLQRISHEDSKLVHSLTAKIPEKDYDAALLNYVLQVIPEQEERLSVLEKVCDSVKQGGYVVLTVRNADDIKRFVAPNGTLYLDGFLTIKSGRTVFAKGYSFQEVEELLGCQELVPIKIYKERYSYTAIGKKK